MSIAILGVNHKTAPVSLREKVAFSNELIDTALYSLNQHPLIEGGMILSTCNRTEIYISYDNSLDPITVKMAVKNWMMQYHQLPAGDFDECLYWHQNEQAVSHLMRVASGIDSMIVGEAQILGQVKQAYVYSHRNRCLSPVLEKLLQRVFYVAKRIRTETHIGLNSASVAFSAGLIARQLFTNPSELNVMLIGAGETIELIARYLKPHGFKKVLVANRTKQKALKLASLLNAEIIGLPDIALQLKDMDIVISSTASPLPIIGKGMVERCMASRKQQGGKSPTMLFIDLAVPRDVEPEVAEVENVFLHTIDDLEHTVQTNIEQRKIAAAQAELIIEHELALFYEWVKSRDAAQLIKQYRGQAEAIKLELTTKAINAIKQGGDVGKIMTKFSHQLTNRLIHSPTQSLIKAAHHQCDECLKVLSDGLGLKEH
ncbi:glutamyl-tRNA reductase [Orbaceae bacterium ac157xtp]